MQGVTMGTCCAPADANLYLGGGVEKGYLLRWGSQCIPGPCNLLVKVYWWYTTDQLEEFLGGACVVDLRPGQVMSHAEYSWCFLAGGYLGDWEQPYDALLEGVVMITTLDTLPELPTKIKIRQSFPTGGKTPLSWGLNLGCFFIWGVILCIVWVMPPSTFKDLHIAGYHLHIYKMRRSTFLFNPYWGDPN